MSEKWVFTIITFMIGFMLAIQFQTTQEPVIRDTRDVRELRKELLAEQEKHEQLTIEINKTQKVLTKYNKTADSQEDEITEVLNEQIYELRKEAGLEEKIGEGLLITIDSLNTNEAFDQDRRTPPPDVFRYLVNELNIYGAENIAVGNERIVSISAFRDVNGITFLNSRRLPPLPIEIMVLSKKSEALQNQMIVSESIEHFEIRGFSVKMEMKGGLRLPAYDGTPRVRYMEEMKEG